MRKKCRLKKKKGKKKTYPNSFLRWQEARSRTYAAMQDNGTEFHRCEDGQCATIKTMMEGKAYIRHHAMELDLKGCDGMKKRAAADAKACTIHTRSCTFTVADRTACAFHTRTMSATERRELTAACREALDRYAGKCNTADDRWARGVRKMGFGWR